jgi:hypothetical protein
LYTLSSFVSLHSHMGLSDSLSVSFLIISVYLVYQYKMSDKIILLLLSGFFISWSVFLRPVHLLFFPFICLLYTEGGLFSIKKYLRPIVVFCIPLIIALLIWGIHNYKKTQRFIVLQDKLENCYSCYPPEYLAIRNLIISWGGELLQWIPGSEAEWFYSQDFDYKHQHPFKRNIFTSVYNQDSLFVLKSEYDKILSDSIDPAEKVKIKRLVQEKAERYYEAYKKEHPIAFYFTNRLRFCRVFLFPQTLNLMPFPAKEKMSIIEKIVKGAYIIWLNMMSGLFILGFIISLVTRKKELILISLLPVSYILVMAAGLGYTEQRYLLPAYPFMVLIAGNAVIKVKNVLFRH